MFLKLYLKANIILFLSKVRLCTENGMWASGVYPMQEEALKLVLLALEDGSALSRKVLVLFVVQRLEPRFPQASKTSIGHVVQLLYRASCFKVRTLVTFQLKSKHCLSPKLT